MRVSTAILLAFHFRWCVAETQCAQAPGSCGKQQSSLMQLKSLGVRRAQAQIQHDSFSSTGARLVAYQKFADDMIAMDENKELNISQNTLDAVTVIHEFINGLFTILNGSHTEDLRVVQKCKSIATDCRKLHLTEAYYQEEGAKILEKNTTHKTCRDDRETACVAEAGFCDKYDNYRQDEHVDLDVRVQFLPPCALTDFNDTYMPADDPDLVQVMEACLNKMHRWLSLGFHEVPETINGLWPHYSDCRRNRCLPLKEECRSNQSDYEDAVCFLAKDKSLHCENYLKCIKCQEGDCEAKCAEGGEIGENWQGRAADNETAQRLTCLLDVLFGAQDPDNESGTGYFARAAASERPGLLTTCKEHPYNTTYWELDCKDRNSQPGVCEVPPSPCKTTFLGGYTDRSANRFKLPNTATAGYREEGIQREVESCTPCSPLIEEVDVSDVTC